ncbi:hypothetical protein B0J14DRAFT_657212 [Halenospora varia]|nr:hypothetical protein B0J14DRAFT_657212 [Halenospora varia]
MATKPTHGSIFSNEGNVPRRGGMKPRRAMQAGGLSDSGRHIFNEAAVVQPQQRAHHFDKRGTQAVPRVAWPPIHTREESHRGGYGRFLTASGRFGLYLPRRAVLARLLRVEMEAEDLQDPLGDIITGGELRKNQTLAAGRSRVRVEPAERWDVGYGIWDMRSVWLKNDLSPTQQDESSAAREIEMLWRFMGGEIGDAGLAISAYQRYQRYQQSQSHGCWPRSMDGNVVVEKHK